MARYYPRHGDITWCGKLAAIEAKWSHLIDESDVTSLKQCAEDLQDKLLFSAIIYSETEIVPIAPQIVAIPFPAFLGIEM